MAAPIFTAARKPPTRSRPRRFGRLSSAFAEDRSNSSWSGWSTTTWLTKRNCSDWRSGSRAGRAAKEIENGLRFGYSGAACGPVDPLPVVGGRRYMGNRLAASQNRGRAACSLDRSDGRDVALAGAQPALSLHAAASLAPAADRATGALRACRPRLRGSCNSQRPPIAVREPAAVHLAADCGGGLHGW